jgi:hypothetical protein
MKTFASLAVVGSALAVTTFPSNAMPIGRPGLPVDVSAPQDVRLVCDRYGRCYQARPRYGVVERSYGPRYAPPSYYRAGPSYGYAPGYRQGPSIGLSFGVGPRW